MPVPPDAALLRPKADGDQVLEAGPVKPAADVHDPVPLVAITTWHRRELVRMLTRSIMSSGRDATCARAGAMAQG